MVLWCLCLEFNEKSTLNKKIQLNQEEYVLSSCKMIRLAFVSFSPLRSGCFKSGVLRFFGGFGE